MQAHTQVQQRIQEKLLKAFTPDFIELVNESHMHSVPKNSETHFKLTLVCDSFSGINKVKRHQQIYAILADDMQNPVHALALHLYTPQEWQQREQQSPDSPNCLGGSKKEGKQ